MIAPRSGGGSGGWLVVLGAGTLTAVALIYAVRNLTPLPARVEVDLLVTSGARVNLYVNDLSLPPRTLPVVQGERHTYVFDGITDDITMLRVDPTDDADAGVDMYGLAIVGPDGRLASFGPGQLAGWATDGLRTVDASAERLRLKTTTPFSIVTTTMRVPLPRRGGDWTKALVPLRAADAGWRVLAIALVGLALVASLDPLRRYYAVLLVLAAGTVAGVAWLDPHLPDTAVSARTAVSRATYLGRSTLPGTLSTALVVILSLTWGWLVPVRSTASNGAGVPHLSGARRLRWWQVTAAGVVALLACIQDLNGWATGLRQHQFASHWDSNNLTYWAYLAHTGHLPLRDYWYPYAGLYLFDLPFPTGQVVRWLYQATLFFALFLAVARWRGPAAAALTMAVVWMGDRTGVLISVERYLLAALLVASYVGALSEDRRAFRASLAPFWLACGLALVFDPAQLIYGAAPIAAITLAQVFEASLLGRRHALQVAYRVGGELIVPAGMAGVWAVICAATGQLPGLLEFYTRLGDAVAYSAYLTGFPELTARGFPRILVFLTCAALAISIGTYEVRHGGSRRFSGYAGAATGLVALMVMQKHLVRWMDDQLLLFALFAVLVPCLGWPGRRLGTERLAYGGVLGLACAVLILQPEAPGLAAQFRRSTAVLADNLALLAAPGDLAAAVNRERFSRERFATFLAELRAIDVIRGVAGPGGDTRVMALTDEPIMYLLSGQPAVWMSNMYDASPMQRQRRVVTWMREERPPFLVFRRERLQFDDVPLVVRVPLVTAEAVASYVPLDTSGELLILRRRTAGERPAWAFWRESLGSTIALGHLAAVSSYAPTADCARSCGDLLDVTVPEGVSSPVALAISIGEESFAVTFQPAAGVTRYRILLDRLWFWDLAKQTGVTPVIGPAQVPGISIAREKTLLRADRLY